eukprot:jgi/Mesvir1/28708/Mv19679-RA.1
MARRKDAPGTISNIASYECIVRRNSMQTGAPRRECLRFPLSAGAGTLTAADSTACGSPLPGCIPDAAVPGRHPSPVHALSLEHPNSAHASRDSARYVRACRRGEEANLAAAIVLFWVASLHPRWVAAKMVSGSGAMKQKVVVDARNHMLGRLASIIAKELVNGQKVVVVRCEDICLSGGLVRQKAKYCRFLRKRMNTKPSKGPIHYRAPARILWRTIRGMLPHKEKKGAAALERLKCFEGVPKDYETTKRMVVPEALRALRMKPGHKYCVLGELSAQVGWKHFDAVKELEAKRKERSAEFYQKKKELLRLRVKAVAAAAPQLKAVQPILQKFTLV